MKRLKVDRIIDANLNRAVEGVRVIEEIARFILDDKKATAELKKIRSELRQFKPELNARAAEADVGGQSYTRSEARRESLLDIFSANIKRVQEAARVLEEYAKLFDPKLGKTAKRIRFQVYELEKCLYYPLCRLVKLDHSMQVVTDNLQTVKMALANGVRMIQLRDKLAGPKELLAKAKAFRRLADKFGVSLIVNDSIAIAKEAGADGVHLGQEDLKGRSLAKIRKTLGAGKLIGVSAGNLAEALKAEKAGADYLGVGPIFKTPNKETCRPIGLNTLKAIVKSVKIPVVAIGGIDETNVSKIIKAGCRRVAVIRAGEKRKNLRKLSGKLNAGF